MRRRWPIPVLAVVVTAVATLTALGMTSGLLPDAMKPGIHGARTHWIRGFMACAPPVAMLGTMTGLTRGRRDPAAGAPVLIVVGGLPATGKSTVASALARQAGFTFVRVDRIEQAIIDSAGPGQPLRQPLGPVGYTVAYGVAAEQLAHGVSVVAECVNPLGVTRTPAEAVATILAAIPGRAGHVSADQD